MFKLLIVVAFATLAKSHDVIIGPHLEGKKIFDENRQGSASAAFFKQNAEKVTINATEGEVISKINVTDLRPDKEGYATIVEGGQGQKFVTLELQSPAAFRGYDFHIEVYSAPKDILSTTTSTTTQKVPEILHPIHTAERREDRKQVEVRPPILSTKNQKESNLHSMSTDTKVNKEATSDEANAEKIPRITIDLSKNDNNQAHEINNRRVRDTVKQLDEKLNPKVATEPSKRSEFNESPEKALPKTSSDSKRDARDSVPKDKADDAKTALKNENSPSNKTPTAPHDFNRQINLDKGNDNRNNFNNGAVFPVGLVKDSSETNNTSDKERLARGTQEKPKAVSTPAILTNEENKFKLPQISSDNSVNNASVLPATVDDKQTHQNDNTNTASHISFAPIPYASITTETSQNKRETVPTLSDNEKGNKEPVLRNTPQTFGHQKPVNEEKPVISIQ